MLHSFIGSRSGSSGNSSAWLPVAAAWRTVLGMLGAAVLAAAAAAAAATGTTSRVALLDRARRRRRLKDADVSTSDADAQMDAADGDAPQLEDLASTTDLPDPGRKTWRQANETRPRRRPGRVMESDGSREVRSADLPGRQRLFVKTMGCAHNSSDSEYMMGLLQDYGYSFVDDLEAADACLINSCTVKNPSQDSALNLVQRAQKAGKSVVLAGCVPSADTALADGLKGVSMLSVAQLDRVVEVVEEATRGHVVKLLGKHRSLPSLELPKVRRNSYIEIIPISGGCLGNCSYCKTKHARGKLSSYAEEAIVGRALQAASEGVSEVWLASEDTGAYGLDIGTNIAALLRRVADELPPGVMLKLGMTNPPYMLAHIEAVAEVLKRPNVFGFLHVPVQSGSDQVLRGMVREYTASDFRRLIDGLRASAPEVTIATDIICGFPNEAEDDHKASMSLVEDYRFPILNISQFYPRPGTPAARLKKLPGDVVKRRSTEMTKLFESYTTYELLVGREERAWFSETNARHGQTVGHTKYYAKVVVPRDDDLLGRSAIVRLRTATKWHVEADVIGELR